MSMLAAKQGEGFPSKGASNGQSADRRHEAAETLCRNEQGLGPRLPKSAEARGALRIR